MAKKSSEPKFPVNPELEAAVIAHAEEDAPRLMYADWLDDHGDPDRAAFIRTQVALWDKNPADADYVDQLEAGIEARECIRLERLIPPLPPELSVHDLRQHSSLTPDSIDYPYQRGFAMLCASNRKQFQNEPPANYISKLREAITNTFDTTTFRGLQLSTHEVPGVGQLLVPTVASRLAVVDFYTRYATLEVSPFAVLASSEAVSALQCLAASNLSSEADLTHLGQARFEQLRRFNCVTLNAPAAAVAKFFGSRGASKLHRVGIEVPPETADGLAGLGALSELHTLELTSTRHEHFTALARAKRLPALARLVLKWTSFGKIGPDALVALEMPNLTALEIRGERAHGPLAIENPDVVKMTRAAWFEQLAVLHIQSTKLSETGLKAIAASPSAQTLRVLSLGDTKFGKGGLALIGAAGTFPKLTSLDLGSAYDSARDIRPEEITPAIAAWSNPNIRHLNLDNWPVDDNVAKAIAKNPAFANLRSLKIGSGKFAQCIKTAGLRAIAESPHLQNLVFFSAKGTKVQSAAELFCDPALLPNLGACGIVGERSAKTVGAKLTKARPRVRWF